MELRWMLDVGCFFVSAEPPQRMLVLVYWGVHILRNLVRSCQATSKLTEMPERCPLLLTNAE